jgi:hypothetical protein
VDDYKLWAEFRAQKEQRKEILKRIHIAIDKSRLLCELTEGIDPFGLFKKITDLAHNYTLGHRYRATLLKCINQMTKPRITKAQFDFAFNNYRGIYRGKLEIDNRLYPLPEQKYHEIAMNIWRKRGMPKFGKRKVTGVRFGPPVTKVVHRHGCYPVIIERTIGVYIYQDAFSKRTNIRVEIDG